MTRSLFQKGFDVFKKNNRNMLKKVISGITILFLFFVFNANSFAQNDKNSKNKKVKSKITQRKQLKSKKESFSDRFERLEQMDVNSEVSVIRGIEIAIGKILNSPMMKNKMAFKLLQSALIKFSNFQSGNGGKYVLGDPGNIFHRARNDASDIDSLIYRKLYDNVNDRISIETRNVLKLYKDRMQKDRELLQRYLKYGYSN